MTRHHPLVVLLAVALLAVAPSARAMDDFDAAAADAQSGMDGGPSGEVSGEVAVDPRANVHSANSLNFGISQRRAMLASPQGRALAKIGHPIFEAESTMVKLYDEVLSVSTSLDSSELFQGLMDVMSRLVTPASSGNEQTSSTVAWHNPAFFGSYKDGFSYAIPDDYIRNLGYYFSLETIEAKRTVEEFGKFITDLTDEQRKKKGADYYIAKYQTYLTSNKADSTLKKFINMYWTSQLIEGGDPRTALSEDSSKQMDWALRWQNMCEKDITFLQEVSPQQKAELEATFPSLFSTFKIAPSSDACNVAWSYVDFGIGATCLQRRLKMPCYGLPIGNVESAEDINSWVNFFPFCPASVIASSSAGTGEWADVRYPPVQECEGLYPNILHSIYRVLKEQDANGYRNYCRRFEDLAQKTAHPVFIYAANECAEIMGALESDGHLVGKRAGESCVAKGNCVLSPCTAQVLEKLQSFYEADIPRFTDGPPPFDPYWQLVMNLVSNQCDTTASVDGLNMLQAATGSTGDLVFKVKGADVTLPECRVGTNRGKSMNTKSKWVYPSWINFKAEFDSINPNFVEGRASPKMVCNDMFPPEHGEGTGANTFTISSAELMTKRGSKLGTPVDPGFTMIDYAKFSQSFKPTSQRSGRSTSAAPTGADGAGGHNAAADIGGFEEELTESPTDAAGDNYARQMMGDTAVTPLDM